MGCILNAVDLPIALQKHVLRQFFGHLAIAQEAQCKAKHHRLVLGHDTGEINRHISYYGQSLPEFARRSE